MHQKNKNRGKRHKKDLWEVFPKCEKPVNKEKKKKKQLSHKENKSDSNILEIEKKSPASILAIKIIQKNQ